MEEKGTAEKASEEEWDLFSGSRVEEGEARDGTETERGQE